MANKKFTDKEVEDFKAKYKGRGKILYSGLKYLTDKNFFVNKQFDNKNFAVFAISDNGKSYGLMALFKTKKVAIEFAKEVGLTKVSPPKYEEFVGD
jgi:hypothetical protein